MSAADVARMGGQWALGVEIVDPRFPSFDFRALDNTADNSSSAAVRIGEFRSGITELVELEISFDSGVDLRRGRGREVMGSPWDALAWLVQSLDDEGQTLSQGEIVFTGGLTAPFDLEPSSTYRVVAEGFEALTLEVA